MRTRPLVIALVALVLVGLPGRSEASGQGEGPLAEVRRLLVAGAIDEAQAALDAIRESETDPAELRILEGLLAQQRGEHRDAVWALREALDLRPGNVSIHLYLGQSLYALGDLDGAQRELLAGEGAGEGIVGYFALLAAVRSDLGQDEEAVRTLDRGLARFEGSPDLLRPMALVLIRLGLVRAAMEPARRFLEAEPDDPWGYLVLAEALRVAGDHDRACVLLEEAMLRFPDDPEIPLRLAYAYAADSRPGTSARMFIRAQALRPDYEWEIAEELRGAGEPGRALVYNAQVSDPGRKLPQRLAIYSEMERWERAAALGPALEELPDLDDASSYQLAYACCMAGEREALERVAASIDDPWLRAAAEELVELAADTP